MLVARAKAHCHGFLFTSVFVGLDEEAEREFISPYTNVLATIVAYVVVRDRLENPLEGRVPDSCLSKNIRTRLDQGDQRPNRTNKREEGEFR